MPIARHTTNRSGHQVSLHTHLETTRSLLNYNVCPNALFGPWSCFGRGQLSAGTLGGRNKPRQLPECNYSLLFNISSFSQQG